MEDDTVNKEEEEYIPAKPNKTTKVSKISNYQTSNLEVESSPKFKRWSQSSNNYNSQDDYTYGQDTNRNPEDEGNENDFDQSTIDQIEEPRQIKKRMPELMMTIAAPVFDTKNFSNTTEKYLEKNVWKHRQIEVRSANLLGVAGIDVPMREITRLTPAYRVSLNLIFYMDNNLRGI